tara:strand:- start:2306 stop:3673 length:1368 start_codon:yes stop_codon:yes gene_type:complete
MGDIFSSGKQNVVVEINKEKINSKEFVNYLQKVNLTKDDVEAIRQGKLLDDILNNYVSEKIVDIEAKKKGIQLSDQSLKEIILNDKSFHNNGKFSRTKYEKFLLEKGFTAPVYERYIKSIELKGQLLNYYSGGLKLPKFIINEQFIKENKTKEIEFLNLSKIYSKNKILENDIQKFYDENISFFKEKFISFRYLKMLPEYLTEKKEYDEDYYKKIDEIENDILDGKSFVDIVSGNEKYIKEINLVNSRKIGKDGSNELKINDIVFNKVFEINEKNTPNFINNENDYYIVEVYDEKIITLTLEDEELKNTIISQLQIRHKLNKNKEIIDKINENNFNKNDMINLSNSKKVLIEKAVLKGINDTKLFEKKLIEKIYDHNVNETFLISDTILQKNYIVFIAKENVPIIKDKLKDYQKHVNKARSNYISKIYKSYDSYINNTYKIDVNQKVLERIKNSF